MLVSALGATLVGFALLVLALVTGTLWLAVACIVICVGGALLLLADTLGLRSPVPTRLRRRRTAGEAAASVLDGDPVDDGGDAPTEQFPRVSDEDVVVLGDAEPDAGAEPHEDAPEAAVHHGRHERPDREPDTGDDVEAPAGHDPAGDVSRGDDAGKHPASVRHPRHGTPD